MSKPVDEFEAPKEYPEHAFCDICGDCYLCGPCYCEFGLLDLEERLGND